MIAGDVAAVAHVDDNDEGDDDDAHNSNKLKYNECSLRYRS